MSWTQDEAENAMVEVKKRAVTDQAFRELVLADPSKAVLEVTGKQIPAGVKIKVIEADPSYHMTFVLPPMVSGELSEDDLEKVAGGACFIDIGCGAEACAAQACAESGK